MKILKVTLAAIAVIFATMTVNAQTAEEVNAKFNEAATLVNGGKMAEAIPVLNQVVELGLKAGADVIETVQNAQKLLPKCYFSKGIASAKTGNLEAALPDFQTAAEMGELYGDLATARNATGMVSKVYTMLAANAFNSKDYAKAAEIFAKGYAANPTDTAIGLNLAMSYCEMGDLEKGIAVYKQIVALEAKHSKYAEAAAEAKQKAAYYLMLEAAKAAEAKDNDKVFAVVDQILEVDSVSSQAQLLRIQTYTNLKNFDKVIEFGEAAALAQTTPEFKSDAYFLLGAAFQNKENKAKAIEIYKKVVAGNNVATAKAQIAALSK